ncbi:MAG: hypothetical protein CM15mP62_31910 [Rhodospirillaceae bacterium]|nr:MAG: hypothetical protein CM15mP62_31910 [Rhodospirillaceae bacterium]
MANELYQKQIIELARESRKEHVLMLPIPLFDLTTSLRGQDRLRFFNRRMGHQ